MNRIIVLCFIMLATSAGFAQHEAEHGGHAELLRHRLAGGFGYTHVSEGSDHSTEEEGILVPTLALEYFYRFSHKWSAGIAADFELKQYLIPFLDDFLERHNALIIAVVGAYELVPQWGVFAGGGMEIEDHKNFAVLRMGTEYEFPIGKEWDITPSVTFEYKEEYSTWGFMVAVGKRF